MLKKGDPMIISASRRTDIPAFFAEWFFNRLRAGFCTVRNPFNAKQVSTISLAPADVDAIVFWSKNPAPLLPRLKELDAMGYRYYFLFTLNDYPKELEGELPSIEKRIETFKALSAEIGPDKTVWRYDPIIISNQTPAPWHRERFERLCAALAGQTRRVITSPLEFYRKTERNLAPLAQAGWAFEKNSLGPEDLLRFMARTAESAGMEIFSCAQERDLSPLGIKPGKCIDGALLERLFGLGLNYKKDSGQRPACGCVRSRDIGANDTCVHNCRYCYATQNYPLAQKRFAAHDPLAEGLFHPAPREE